jgi:hypothetical protein
MKGDLYIAAESSNSTYDNPRWCRIPASHVVPLLNELARCREIIQKFGVAGVHVNFNAATWGPSAVAEDLGLASSELFVGPYNFLLRSWPEGLAPVETHYMPAEAFEAAVREGRRCFVCDPRFAESGHERDEASLLMAEAADDEAKSETDVAA